MTDLTQFRWTSASCTHVGLVREINEDACLDQPGRRVWAVADGMGGHSVGDVASRTVIKSLGKIRQHDSLSTSVAEARQQLEIANHQLRAEAARRGVQIIGSTVVVMLACDRSCACLWAGDSRLYLYRDGQLTQLTRDHSQAEARKSQRRSSPEDFPTPAPHNVITRAVGAVDLLELDEERVSVNDGDIFLLCSDGLTNQVSEQEITGALVAGNCKQAAKALVDLALAGGGRDNISAVVVQAEDLYGSDKTMLNPAL